MFVSDCLSVNDRGHLTIGGADTLELAAQFGTPLYAFDETQIRSTCRRYKASIEKYYGGYGRPAYASKAFCCKEMCRIAASEGMGLDVVSSGELYTALAAGFPAENIYFHGNNKTPEELAYAIRSGVGHIVADNIAELDILEQLASAANAHQKVLFRVKPGVDAHTHDFVKTGCIDSKFGFALETGEAFESIRRAASLSCLVVEGIHCHIGSQIFDIDPFELAAERMLGLAAKVRDELGFEMETLNMGGGIGIKYLQTDDPQSYEIFLERISSAIEANCAKHNLKKPFLVIEPGRSIVAPAGITIYKVGAVKEIPGIRTYVSVDGGMTDNPRYALYQSKYDMMIANKATETKSQSVTVAGRCCESGDLLGEDVPLQKAQVGDTLAVLATGAYNYSMASHYNRVPKAAVVMIGENSEPRVIVKRESYEELLRSDI